MRVQLRCCSERKASACMAARDPALKADALCGDYSFVWNLAFCLRLSLKSVETSVNIIAKSRDVKNKNLKGHGHVYSHQPPMP